MPSRHTLTLLIAVASLGGCTLLPNLEPNSFPRKAVNAEPVGSDEAVLLDGVDVVAYRTMGLQVYGQPQFQTLHQGVSLRFTSAAHKAMFDADPQKYLPAYGGLCANAMVYGIPRRGDPGWWRIVDGRLVLFENRAARDAFMLDTSKSLALADRYWQTEVSRRNAYAQWLLRKTLRVPHWRSDEDLAADVAAAQAAKR